MNGLVLAEERWQGDHHYTIHDVELDDLVEVLAEIVRDLYVEPDTLRRTLQDALTGLDDVVDTGDVEEIIAAVADASVPEAGTRDEQPWLDMARNEVAEVLAYVAAERIYGATVVAKRIRHKEVPSQPTRGIDLIALGEDPHLYLLCGEVKASTSTKSPPSVVGESPDSLKAQLVGHIQNRSKILQELNWLHKHAPETEKKIGSSRHYKMGNGRTADTSIGGPASTEPSWAGHRLGRIHRLPKRFPSGIS